MHLPHLCVQSLKLGTHFLFSPQRPPEHGFLLQIDSSTKESFVCTRLFVKMYHGGSNKYILSLSITSACSSASVTRYGTILFWTASLLSTKIFSIFAVRTHYVNGKLIIIEAKFCLTLSEERNPISGNKIISKLL